MATGINFFTDWLVSISAYNYVNGTDNDDTIKIQQDIYTAYYSSTEIKLLDGNDTVWIGGKMTGYGETTISGGTGNKNIMVAQGMNSDAGAINLISLGGNADDLHNITLGGLTSKNYSSNKIVTGAGTDNIVFNELVEVFEGSFNSIELGDGTKNITFNKKVDAYFGGSNIISLGNGDHSITFAGELNANRYAKNDIFTLSGDTVLNIQGQLFSNGSNTIHLGDGNHAINIAGITADYFGTNYITTVGTTTLTVENNIISYNLNSIQTGAGNDEVIIKGGLSAIAGDNIIDTGAGDDYIYIGTITYASNGNNYIFTGDGNNTVEIRGAVYSNWGSSTYINAGSGNDHIIVDGQVSAASLYINAGEGYDTLSLMAVTATEFTNRYENWLSDLASTKGLTATGLNFFNIEIGSANNLTQIDWLTQIVNNHNAENVDDQIYIGINVDSWGSAFSLNHLFSAANEQAINTINLTGNTANELTIKDFLATNGYNNSVLHVNGDANDTIKFNDVWEQTQTNIVDENTGISYNVYHNANNEDVFVQAGVNVLFV